MTDAFSFKVEGLESLGRGPAHHATTAAINRLQCTSNGGFYSGTVILPPLAKR